MWVKSTGALSEHTYQITTPLSSHLVISGAKAALVDCGLGATAPHLVGILNTLLSEEVPLCFLLLTHTHFDHVGGLWHLRKHFPSLQVVGAPESQEFLAKPEFVRDLFEQNRLAAEALKSEWKPTFEEWREALRIDRIVGEGDTIDLGDGIDVKVVRSPGHTHDSIAFYVRSDLTLCSGESVGSYHGRDKGAPAFLSSYDDYLASLDKLSTLDVRVLSLSHCGALTGDLAKKHLLASRAFAEQLYLQVKERLQSEEGRDAIVTDLFSSWGIEGLSPDGPFVGSQRFAIQQMVDQVAQDL